MSLNQSIELPFGRITASSFSHRVQHLQLVETHLSWVILTGSYAYKLKKPVSLGFVDYRSLTLRKHFCEREIEINQQYARDIYKRVEPISRFDGKLLFGNHQNPIEYAVVMRQFNEQALVSSRIAAGQIGRAEAKSLGSELAGWHQDAPIVRVDEAPSINSLQDRFDTMIDTIMKLAPKSHIAGLMRVRDWGERFLRSRAARFVARAEHGQVRHCHGDLHLDNLLLEKDSFAAFDAIDFDDSLRRIDVAADLAFPVMDIAAQGRADLAHLVLSSYIEKSGDYDLLGVIRFFLVERALVRALVTLLRSSDAARFDKAWTYLDAAMRSMTGSALHLAITHGVAGSGKTTAARTYSAETGAIWIRSDIERRRVPADLDTTAVQDRYSDLAIRRTYDRLYELADQALRDGWPIIVDATFLNHSRRRRFAELAADLGIPFSIVDCPIAFADAAERITARAERGRDASEADIAVLTRQVHDAEPLTLAERNCVCCGQFEGCHQRVGCPVPGMWETDSATAAT